MKCESSVYPRLSGGMVPKRSEVLRVTPPKSNVEPNNEGLEDESPFQRLKFSGSMLVGGVFYVWGKTYKKIKKGTFFE